MMPYESMAVLSTGVVAPCSAIKGLSEPIFEKDISKDIQII
jgi:hypothetical protein